MAVDSERGKHHINRVGVDELGILWSAQSYRPEVTDAIRRVKSFSWMKLQQIIAHPISPGPHPHYGGTYPCLKTKNVQKLLAETEPADYADVSDIDPLDRVQVANGDLLINLTGAGSIGRVAVYYGDEKPITNQHLAKMRVKDGFHEGYVAAFLASYWGERGLEQGVAGSTGQINMVNEHVRSVAVPVFDHRACSYIGNKVRQAERLRAWARERESRILEDASDPEIERALGVLADNFHRVSARRIGHRLDPKYYDSKSLAVLDATSVDAVSVGEIAKSISNGFEERAFYATGIPYITVTEVASGRIDLENAPRIDSETEVPFRACINPKCVLVVRTGSIGTAVRVYAEDSGAVISSHFIRVEFETEAIASAVAAFLSSTAGRVLQHKISYGAVQPQIGQDELLALPIPKRLIDGAEELNGTAGHVDQAIRFSSSLTSAAKLLVEALIEGQITEQELIHAQQSQEAGDPGPDQAILARLKSDGLDGEGDPLFPDPERLQTLLERATADDADGEVADAT